MKTEPFVLVYAPSTTEIGRRPAAREIAAAQLKQWRKQYRRVIVKRLISRNCYSHGNVTVVIPTPIVQVR